MGFLSLLDLKNWLSLERISLCNSGPSPSLLSLCWEDEFVFWCVFPLPPTFYILLKWTLGWFSITTWFRIIKDNDKEWMVLSHLEAHYWIDTCRSRQATSLSTASGDPVNALILRDLCDTHLLHEPFVVILGIQWVSSFSKILQTDCPFNLCVGLQLSLPRIGNVLCKCLWLVILL